MKLAVHVAFDRTADLAAHLGDRVAAAVERTALAVETDWKAGVRVDTGRLRRSITTRKVRATAYEVSTNVEYAPFEEYGTRFMGGSHARTRAVEKQRRLHADRVAGVLK